MIIKRIKKVKRSIEKLYNYLEITVGLLMIADIRLQAIEGAVGVTEETNPEEYKIINKYLDDVLDIMEREDAADDQP